jgi:hypothetical protein
LITTVKQIIASHSLQSFVRKVNFTQILAVSSQQSITDAGGNRNCILIFDGNANGVVLFHITSLGFWYMPLPAGLKEFVVALYIVIFGCIAPMAPAW